MGVFVDPNFGKKKGKIIKMADKDMIGSVKKPKNEVWLGFSRTKSGDRITRMMTEDNALDWSKETGKNVWKKMTVGELREL